VSSANKRSAVNFLSLFKKIH